ncbi:hypothetical protein CBD41_01580 [bacterium TMED181]|nr:hypothetical protein [Planctomycetota bacterium]OUW47074.1 MAG: hypothetical protein CBD41_01580 [bacterium TMED181]
MNDPLGLRRNHGRQILSQISRLVKERFLQGEPADIEAETLFRDQTAARFPEDPISGEELGLDPQTREEGWIIDPLDGSTNHSRGIPIFAVSIAYRSQGKTVMGWISDPVRGEWIEAIAGGGILGGGLLPLRKSSQKLPMIHLTPRWRKKRPRWRNFLPSHIKQRTLGSIALEMAWIAQGRIDAGAWYQTHEWDVAAGLLLISESGGRVCPVLNGGKGEYVAISAHHHHLLSSLQDCIEDHGSGLATFSDGKLY